MIYQVDHSDVCADNVLCFSITPAKIQLRSLHEVRVAVIDSPDDIIKKSILTLSKDKKFAIITAADGSSKSYRISKFCETSVRVWANDPFDGLDMDYMPRIPEDNTIEYMI